jgi:hypothetical protein
MALEPSIIAAEPFDEFLMEIADWIAHVTHGLQNVEVEAKIGTLIDTRSGERLQLPSRVECILPDGFPDIRFEASVPQSSHAHLNQLLNDLATSTVRSSGRAPIKYRHTRQIDSFYPLGSGSDKVRVSMDEASNELVACIIKKKIAHLNISSPRKPVDWRVSISVEEPASRPPPAQRPLHSRRKDRLTYEHQAFLIDLTQVTPSAPTQPQTHEMEVEFRDPTELCKLAKARERGDQQAADMYHELIYVFINNVRILAKNAQ